MAVDIVAQAGQLIHLAALAGTALWGAVKIGQKPSRLLVFLDPRHWIVWGPLVGLTLCAIGAGALALAVEDLDPQRFATILLVFSLFSIAISAVVYPGAVSTDNARSESQFHAKSPVPYFWLLITLVWSYTSIFVVLSLSSLVAGRNIEMKVIEQGMVSLFDTSKPIAFLAFSLFGVAAAFNEEILFRGGIQGALSETRIGAAGAILITSLLFAAPHMGAYVEPFGLKELQVFGLGVIFGLARHMYGLRAAILLHVVNNTSALILQTMMPINP